MQENSLNISNHVREFQTFLCGYLTGCLPKICSGSDDWWQIMVRGARLRGSQKNRIRNGAISRMEDLDIVSLCSLLSSQWEQIIKWTGIEDSHYQGRLLCDSIINLRNRLSHEGAGNRLEPEEELRAVMDLAKMCEFLEAPESLLNDLEQDKNQLMNSLSGASSTNPLYPSDSKGGSNSSLITSFNPIMEDQGIPLDVFDGSGDQGGELEAALSMTTFVGIDFGTSTTVASRVFFDLERQMLTTEPIPIPQIDRLGRSIEDCLVPSCISYVNGKNLFGHGAAELKSELTQGIDTWFSFKMELGVDLGPKYPRSKLDGREGREELRRPQDAAVLFFRYLRQHIESWVEQQELPKDVRYAVSVPASFEANQRLDLCKVMKTAGLDVEDNAIIDEPNAAFVSYLLDTLSIGDGIVGTFRDESKKALVFDFGAGTCDISVLEVTGKEDRLVSQNLAISRFQALGGDNIDRQIARRILWPVIEKNCLKPGQRLRQAQFEQVVLPRLQPVAERLKIQCCKWITTRAQGGDLSLYRESDEEICEGAIEQICIGEVLLELEQPSIRLRDFFMIMEPFLAEPVCKADDPEQISVLEPINSALEKAKLTSDDLDMVLFIGGSAQNPLVQEAIRAHVGRFVECVMGRDVRTPVSRGASLHSLVWNGLEFQFIKPITSETISIITVGDNLHPLIPAGSPIPSQEGNFTDGLVVAKDGQAKVELPICVSTSSKILHTLELRPPDNNAFSAGDRITVSASLDEHKLLHIQAKLGQVVARGELINPLSNSALSPKETDRLKARQHLNESMLANNGKPEPRALERFGDACADSGAYLEAAETFEALYRMDPTFKNSSNATRICYCYAHCDRSDLSKKWAEEAYRCEPTWVSAYNLALKFRLAGDEERVLELLREAYQLNARQPSVLVELGSILVRQGETEEGDVFLHKALEIYQSLLKSGEMNRDTVARAKRLGTTMEETEFLQKLSDYECKLAADDVSYSEDNLAVSTDAQRLEI